MDNNKPFYRNFIFWIIMVMTLIATAFIPGVRNSFKAGVNRKLNSKGN
jgi:hypothetical protein